MSKPWIDFAQDEYERLWRKSQEDFWWTFVPIRYSCPVKFSIGRQLKTLLFRFKMS